MKFITAKKPKNLFILRQQETILTILPNQVPQLIEDVFRARILTKTKLLIFWSLLTAVRPAEVVSVEWREIDWENCL